MIYCDGFRGYAHCFQRDSIQHLMVSAFVVVAVSILSVFCFFFISMVLFSFSLNKSTQSGLNLCRRALVDWRCFPGFYNSWTISLVCVCVRVCFFGLFERAISNVVPSLLYTEDFQQPIASSHVPSASVPSTPTIRLICSPERLNLESEAFDASMTSSANISRAAAPARAWFTGRNNVAGKLR